MKILIVSQEVWQDGTNGGNVLSNIFSDMKAEFAQIYCSPGEPSNKLCKQYYQMTDSMVIKNLLKRKPVGRTINYEEFPIQSNKTLTAVKENNSYYSFFSKYRFEAFLVAKELVWKFSEWENKPLEKFVLDFNPDIIFAPCYGSHFMLSLDKYISSLINKPVVSYISDDHYSLKQFRISPIYWINRMVLRRNLRQTFPCYDLTYTMTEEQKNQCEKAFGANMKILRKGGDFTKDFSDKPLVKPIKMIYAGGMYCGRWKTLLAITDALRIINSSETKMILDIYTGNQLKDKQLRGLNDGKNSFVHGLISQDELFEKYHESDIALHVESFDLKYKLLTKLSFSTKIVDCLESTCAVMAICWDQHSGYIYLKNEDAAFVINNTDHILPELKKITDNTELVKLYAHKAFECGQRNHKKEVNQNRLNMDFQNLINK